MTSELLRVPLRPLLALILTAAATLAGLAVAQTEPGGVPSRPYFTEPSLSADGREVVFISAGDVWTAPTAGGEARLLVSHPAVEARPFFSPDGSQLAFTSTRTGNGDLYLLTLATGQLVRLTHADAAEQLSGWSADGAWLYFSSGGQDVGAMPDIYRIRTTGGTPIPVAADRFTSEFFGTPAPDGSTVAISARGIAYNQWWRRGHSHIDEAELWLCRPGSPPTYTRITPEQPLATGAREVWPMWAPDGKSLYYVSDAGGVENIWRCIPGGKPEAITRFREGRVLWPALARDGRTLVFERDFGIWKLDTGSGQTAPIPLTRRGTGALPITEPLSLTTGFRDLAVSPDGKKLALVARGEIFAAPVADGGDAVRITHTPAPEMRPVWAPDSRRLVYLSERDGGRRLFLYDFAGRAETQLTHSEQDDAAPVFSPDGKQLAFQRGGRELRVMDLETKQERRLAAAFFDRPPFAPERGLVWSPSGTWLAALAVGTKGFKNPILIRADGSDGETHPAGFLPNVFGNSLSWSPDGRFLLYDSGQRTENWRLSRVDLVPRPPRFREEQFRELFQEKPVAAPVPALVGATVPERVDMPGLRERQSVLPLGMDVDFHAIAPNGKTLVFLANVAGQQNLYTYSLDELSREPAVARQLTSTAGRKTEVQFAADGREVYFLEGGRVQVANVDSRAIRSIGITAELDVVFDREKQEVFRQAWTVLRDFFYDEQFHGVDWSRVRERYAPYAAGAQTPEELRRLLSLMVGELDASHLGVSGPGFAAPQTGCLGLRFDPEELIRSGRLRVAEVIPFGPAALGGELHAGDFLLGVNGEALAPRTNLDALLQRRIGRRTELTVATSPGGEQRRTVVVQPISGAAERELLYRQWVEQRRELVRQASGGRLGYVHMPDMGQASLEKLYLDLDAQNQSCEAVVVDVRHNQGGFVNAYALDVLARRPYLTFRERGFPPAPARTALGQRALELPTVLLTNQHSLSDAEDFAEGYRVQKLGKVVGEPTAGWIIYTSSVTLLDGTTLRVPFIEVRGADGRVMERNPRPVDVPVRRPVGESYSGKDRQLAEGVRVLLRQLEEGKR